MTRDERAARFRALHVKGAAFVLPNAWDAASARIFVEAEFPALGTTSAGIANSLGFRDGERIDFALHSAVVKRIVDLVDVPVTVDLEAGYSRSLDGLVRNVLAIAELGAVGINLEDAYEETHILPLDEARARVAAVATALRERQIPFYLNARTDVYLGSIGEPSTRLEHARERLRAYREAGADGVFLPGTSDPDVIREIASTVDAPLNVLAGPSLPDVATLRTLGVARISTGSGPMRRTLGTLRQIACELRDEGTFGYTRDGIVPYAEANALFRA